MTVLKMSGEIWCFEFESVKLQMAKLTWYTPDFLVVGPLGIEIHETKGHWEDDARVKWKVAAEKFWYFTFKAIQWKGKQWKIEVYK